MFCMGPYSDCKRTASYTSCQAVGNAWVRIPTANGLRPTLRVKQSEMHELLDMTICG